MGRLRDLNEPMLISLAAVSLDIVGGPHGKGRSDAAIALSRRMSGLSEQVFDGGRARTNMAEITAGDAVSHCARCRGPRRSALASKMRREREHSLSGQEPQNARSGSRRGQAMPNGAAARARSRGGLRRPRLDDFRQEAAGGLKGPARQHTDRNSLRPRAGLCRFSGCKQILWRKFTGAANREIGDSNREIAGKGRGTRPNVAETLAVASPDRDWARCASLQTHGVLPATLLGAARRRSRRLPASARPFSARRRPRQHVFLRTWRGRWSPRHATPAQPAFRDDPWPSRSVGGAP